MKLLSVDSNIYIQRLYKEELEEEGYEVISASTGRDALEKFNTEKPDVVITDILLSDIDGAELTKKIKEREPAIPVIMAAAFDYREDFNALPLDVYLLKSSDLSELKTNIRMLLQEKNVTCS